MAKFIVTLRDLFTILKCIMLNSSGTISSNEIMWVHVVRIVSVFLVVWIHSAAEVFFLGAKFNSFEWWIGNIYDSLARVCVPMLFMITGYLLLEGEESVAAFLKKRMRKVLIPLFAWSAFFLLFINLWEYQHPSLASSMTPDYLGALHKGGWYALIAMLWAPVYYHLWFMYAIVGLYFVTPFLRVIAKNGGKTMLWYFAFLSMMASTILPSIEYFSEVPSQIDLGMVRGSVGYLVLGYLLGHIVLTRRIFWSMVAVALVSAVVTIVGTYYFTAADKGVLNQTMWREGLNILAMSIAVFIIIRYLSERCETLQFGRLHLVVKVLSSASFGIYLAHVMFLYAFAEGSFGFHLTALTINPVLAVPLLCVSTYTCSLILIYSMQKLPIVRHVVP